MSGQVLLDWPALALSLFNAFILCWLGFTILLEADRRAFGVWLTVDGLLLGAVFFIAHTAILRNGWQWDNPLVNFWWRAGWWPLILSPFAWYCVILWYSGFWDDISSSLNRRQAPWFGLTLIATAGLLVWMVLANPLPDLIGEPGDLSHFTLLAIAFPAYILLCILLALDAILHPGPTPRLMGQEARQRARPWLLASTLVLLVVCFLVAFALIWGINSYSMTYRTEPKAAVSVLLPLTGLDVIIEILITAAILLIGQAAMVYEVFSSNPLPRSGLRKRWFFAVWLGAIFALLFSYVLIYFARPELAYLVFIPFLTASLAIQNRLAAREQTINTDEIRALTRPQKYYERIFNRQDNPSDANEAHLEFEILCKRLLHCKQAILIPSGALGSFLPEELGFPEHVNVKTRHSSLLSSLEKTDRPIPLNPQSTEGFRWAISLVSSRGLDGWLLLGEKLDDELYTMEEIEIARAALENWMDNQAAAEIARRLVNLQKQKQAKTRLVDQEARRVLHDEVLPLLHTALLTAPRGKSADQITNAHRQISDLLRNAPQPPPAAIAREGLFPVLQSLAEHEAELMRAKLVFDVDEESIREANKLPSDAVETVYYAVRECLRNIEKHTQPLVGGDLRIRIKAEVDSMLRIYIENNGIPGENNGSDSVSIGQGIALHNAMLAVFGGGMRLETTESGNVLVTINLPLATG